MTNSQLINSLFTFHECPLARHHDHLIYQESMLTDLTFQWYGYHVFESLSN